MTLFDLLRRITFEVVERAASLTLKRGEVIYCPTSELLGSRSNVGTGPYALRPTEKLEVLNLRKWIIAQIGDEEIRPEHLHEFEYEIRNFYFSTRIVRPIRQKVFLMRTYQPCGANWEWINESDFQWPSVLSVILSAGSHPFPSRTRKLSLLGPMVLRGNCVEE